MNQDITAEDILRAIQFKQRKAGPGLLYDLDARTKSRTREELNNKTIKELNNSSRPSEDEKDEQSPLSSVASPLETPDSGQKDFGSDITAARTTSRYTGIAVQHCVPNAKSSRPGVKLAISLQTAGMAQHGHLLLLTAELKRYKRLREIKARMDDTAAFAQILDQAKQQIYADQDHTIVMGRCHLRGQRSAWIPNVLVIGRIQADCVSQVILFLDDEEYTIKLDHPLTQAQQPLYLSAGQWGSIANPRAHSPNLRAIIQERFGS